MRDLTKGSIPGHLLSMGMFMAVTMLIQTAYFLVDLYFVSRLGKEAVAGVSAAGNVMFLALSVSQVIGVAVTALVSRAIGGGDKRDAEIIFNQGMGMALAMTAVSLVLGYTAGMTLVDRMGASDGAGEAAKTYLAAYMPSLALMFPMQVLGSALRAAGVVKAPTLVQSASIILNIFLAPVLIAGWGTGVPLGVFGAGLASTIAVIATFGAMLWLFPRVQSVMRLNRARMGPRFAEWRRMIGIGAPSGAEFLLMFVTSSVVYFVIRDYGAEAQAGFGIGGRILQSVMMPAMAISFSAAPIVGQNLGAGLGARVRKTFVTATGISAAIMLALALLMHINPSALTRPFSPDEAVLHHANLYLQILSWNMIASGIVFTCSGVFQGLGNTRPSLLSSASRLLTFVAPALWLARQENIPLEWFWWLSVASSLSQAAFSLLLMLRELRLKVGPAPARVRVA